MLIAAALMISVSASAQNCNELKTEKDRFTDETVRHAKMTIGNLLTKWVIEVRETPKESFMTWSIAMQGEFNQKFETGAPLRLKLEDGTFLTLESVEPASPVTKATTSGSSVNIFTIYNLKFKLTGKVVKPLAKSMIVDMQVDVPGQDIRNPKIKDRQMSKLQDIFICLLEG